MTRRSALARAGLVVTIAFLVARILGWLRLVVISTIFGVEADLDAFFAAFRIPDFIFQLVAAGALSSAVIPVVAGLLATEEAERAWRVVSTVTTIMMAALLGLAILFLLAAPALVPVVTPGFSGGQLDQTVELTRVMLLSPIVLAVGSVATSVLNASGRFGASALAPIAYNLAIIGAAVLLAPILGTLGLALGVVAGSLFHLAVQLGPLRRTGFRYRPLIERTDPLARQTLLLMVPRAIGLGASQLTFVVMTSLASTLAAGSITAFTIAFTILQIPIGVIGVPLGIVLLPSLAGDLARGALDDYVRLLIRSIRLLLYMMIPIAGLGMVLREQVVTILFDYGRFDLRAVELTASALAFFLLGLPAHSLIAILARAFYAGKDTLTPVLAAVLAVATNVGIGVASVTVLGLNGLALGIAIGAWVETLVLVVVLRRRVAGLALTGPLRLLAASFAAALLSSLAAAALIRLLADTFGASPAKPFVAAEIALAGGAGLLVYVGLTRALRLPELPTIVELMGQVLRRPRRA